MSERSFRLILLRHGNTFNANEVAYQVGRKTDLALTEKGLQQAAHFVDYLQSEELMPHAIYCGHLKRQSQTAEIIHQAFPQAILHPKQDALDEIDYGQWEGLTTPELQNQWPEEYASWVACGKWPAHLFHSQLEDHLSQLKQWLLSLEKTTPANGLIVAISSNGIIRFMLQFVPGLWDHLVAHQEIEKYKVGTGNFCELECSQQQLKIVSWNCKPVVA